MRNLVLLFLLANIVSSYGQEEGIAFNHKSFGELLKQAKDENKLLFVDAYAVWCGPCKLMTKNTFTDKTVANLYNAKFINAKIDMEKGEGPDLAVKYGVRAYPTLLFINGDGEVVHSGLGYHTPEQFISLGSDALDPAKQIGTAKKRYKAGDKDPSFLRDFALNLNEKMDPMAEEVASAYLKTQSNWKTTENMDFIMTFAHDPDSEMFKYLNNNPTDFKKAFGDDKVEDFQIDVLKSTVPVRNNPDHLKQVQKIYTDINAKKAPERFGLYEIQYLKYIKDGTYLDKAVSYFKKYKPKDAYVLNEFAWNVYETQTDKKYLKPALEWAKKSVEISPMYMNYDTLAALYYKLGNKKEAASTADKAIELAKKSGEDYSETQELAKKISQLP